jgi:uncharacterized repeat protein (TIGR01451 family)
MSKTKTRTRIAGSLVALAVPLVLSGTPATAATVPPAGAFAEAYGLSIDTTILQGNVPVKVAPQAPVASSCPPTGGAKTTSLLSVGDPQLAKADVLNTGAGTDCAKKSSLASAQTTNADALGVIAAAKIHADAITSTSATSCALAPKGSTVVANLTVGGTAVPLPTTIPPNTDLLPQVFGPLGIRVLLNEQHPASTGRGLVVNGLHIIASNTGVIPVGGGVIRGDVIISHAVSGVVCPGGPGTSTGGLPTPDISFTKVATPTVAAPGTVVTYTATVTNNSAVGCEVLRFIEHVAPAFELVSSSGPLGTKLDSPAPTRTDGGVDAVLRPTGVTIGAHKSVTQTFKVKVKDGATPGTYYDELEIFCGPNGDFVSGPLAPVTVPGPNPPVVNPPKPVVTPPNLPRTGGLPLAAGGALLLLLAGLGVHRARMSEG